MFTLIDPELFLPYCTARSFARGSTLYEAGAPGSGLMVLVKGRVKILTEQQSGKPILLYIFMPPQLFGFLPFLDGRPYPVTAVALDDVEVMVMERPTLDRAITENPEIAITMLNALATKLRHTFDILRAASTRAAGPVVATAILSLIPSDWKQDPLIFTIPPPSYDFARDLGITPETLSRELAKLVKQKIIHKVGPGVYQLLCLEQLRGSASHLDFL